MINNKGPSTLPWGTPKEIGWGSDKTPLVQTLWVRMVKKDLNHWTAERLNHWTAERLRNLERNESYTVEGKWSDRN